MSTDLPASSGRLNAHGATGPIKRTKPAAPDAAVTHEQVELAFREESGRVLATLIRLLDGGFDAAEEAVSDAFVAALETWPRDGVPRNPGAWLTTAARNRALDRIRRDRRRAERAVDLERAFDEAAVATDVRMGQESRVVDDRLRLIFTCCHPALPPEARVALTLRTLGGLTTPEIARAFLVPEPTMAQRLVRAKRKIRAAGIPYRVPPDDVLPERLDGVLSVVYLIFNEAYAATSGRELIRRDLATEAIRLARLLANLMPASSETVGLLALLLLQDSRRDARVARGGGLVLLDEQDRSRWDRAEIDEGLALVGRGFVLAQPFGAPGPYLLQAAIASQHAIAQTADATDWRAIASLYTALAAVQPSPVIELNRAVAIDRIEGPGAALLILDGLLSDGELDHYHLLHAARADALRRLGRRAEARAAYVRALETTSNETEVAFLSGRLAEVTDLA